MMSAALCDTFINELRLEGELCDAEIRVDDVKFKVHKIVLCNCSAYFRDLFLSRPSTSELQRIYRFSEVSSPIMSLIVEYAYTCSVVVMEENVLPLMAGADRFAVEGILQACCDFLEQRLSFMNCIDICALADHHKCPELKQKAYLYTLHHFEEVAGFSPKFLQLSVQQLANLIQRDELNVRQESAVFEAVLRWIHFAPEERWGHLTTLLSKVRLLFLSTKYLVDSVSTSALVRKSLPCLNMVIHAMKTLRESNMEPPLTGTRLPFAMLLAIGGWETNSPTDRMDLYDVRADRWLRVNHGLEAPRVFHGSVLLNGHIYCIGGFDGYNYLNSVQKLNLVTQTWQDVGPMHKPRSHVSVVALNGCIYAMGGSNGCEPLETAEQFHPDTNQWTLIAPMQERRSNATTVTLHGKLYVFGGSEGDDPLSAAECYNPHTDQWTLIAPMESWCYGARAVTYGDKIYVAGGYRDDSYMCRVVTYYPPSNQWSVVNPMIHPRVSFGIAVLEDQLYVAGGFNNHEAIRSVECYDEKTSSWQVVRDMETPRGGFVLCVVERDTFAAAYQS